MVSGDAVAAVRDAAARAPPLSARPLVDPPSPTARATSRSLPLRILLAKLLLDRAQLLAQEILALLAAHLVLCLPAIFCRSSRTCTS